MAAAPARRPVQTKEVASRPVTAGEVRDQHIAFAADHVTPSAAASEEELETAPRGLSIEAGYAPRELAALLESNEYKLYEMIGLKRTAPLIMKESAKWCFACAVWNPLMFKAGEAFETVTSGLCAIGSWLGCSAAVTLGGHFQHDYSGQQAVLSAKDLNIEGWKDNTIALLGELGCRDIEIKTIDGKDKLAYKEPESAEIKYIDFPTVKNPSSLKLTWLAAEVLIGECATNAATLASGGAAMGGIVGAVGGATLGTMLAIPDFVLNAPIVYENYRQRVFRSEGILFPPYDEIKPRCCARIEPCALQCARCINPVVYAISLVAAPIMCAHRLGGLAAAAAAACCALITAVPCLMRDQQDYAFPHHQQLQGQTVLPATADAAVRTMNRHVSAETAGVVRAIPTIGGGVASALTGAPASADRFAATYAAVGEVSDRFSVHAAGVDWNPVSLGLAGIGVAASALMYCNQFKAAQKRGYVSDQAQVSSELAGAGKDDADAIAASDDKGTPRRGCFSTAFCCARTEETPEAAKALLPRSPGS